MRSSKQKWFGQRSFGRGLLVGLVVVAVLTLLKLLSADVIGYPTPFLTYFGAVLVAGWIGGFAAALWVTAVAGALTASLFMEPSAAEFWSKTAPQLTLFGAECAMIAALTSGLSAERRRAARAAHDSQQALAQLHVVMRGVDEGIVVQDADGAVVFANRRAAEMCGYDSPEAFVQATRDEVLSRFQFFDVNGGPISFAQLPPNRLLQGEPALAKLLRQYIRGDGEDRWMVVRANPVFDKYGKVEHIVNLFRDISAERRRQRALRESRQWLVTALRSIGDAVIATDPEGKIMFLNPVAEILTGWGSDEAEGKPLSKVFYVLEDATRKPAQSPVERANTDPSIPAISNHTLLVRRDGTELAIDDSVAQIRDSEGELAGVVLVFRDASASRRHEQRREFLIQAANELNTSLDYRETLATMARLAVPTIADWCAIDIVEDGELSRLAVAHVDPDKLAWVNSLGSSAVWEPTSPFGAPKILQTGQPEMITEIPRDRPRATPEQREFADRLGLCSYIGVPLRRGAEVFGVITLLMSESRRTYDSVDLQLAMTLADRASVAVENAQLFARVERSRTEAVQANRAKDEFMAMLGHELRNPLAPIITALELMRLQDNDSFARERTIIDRQVRHVVRLVDDLLDVSRITGGRVELDLARVDIRDVIDKALEMARPLIEQRRQHLDTQIGAGLMVDGDPVRLAQVVANLLNNAAKYSEVEGNVAVSAGREDGEVVIRVRDDGIGIEPNKLPGIFELFVQEPQALDRSQGGLGLGLTIVRSIVELHGGRVMAHSDGQGQGSEFVVRLPSASNVPMVLDPDASEPHDLPSEGERILLVDDNQDALELLTLLLSNLGYAPHPAIDAADALAVAARVRPTVAVVDIGLPGIDGYELGRLLREQAGAREIRLIALTGYGQPSDRVRSREAGFAAHLVKPVSLLELRKALSEA